MEERLREICEDLPLHLVKRSMSFLVAFFIFAAALYFVTTSYPNLVPALLEQWAYQVFLLVSVVLLGVWKWKYCFRISKKAFVLSFGLLVVYFIFLKLLDWAVLLTDVEVVNYRIELDYSVLIRQLVLAPILEELFFRDYLFRSFNIQMRSWKPALIFSSLFFYLAHMGFYPGPLVLGVIACFLLVYFRSIWPCIFFHFASNATLYVFPLYYPRLNSALHEWGLFRMFYS